MKASEPRSMATASKSNSPFFSKDSGQTFFDSSAKGKPFFLQNSKGNAIQAKLSIGQPNDKYEQEADAMADKVVQRLATPDIQTKKEPAIQTKPLVTQITSLVQAKCATCEQEDKLQMKEEEELVQESPLELQLKPIFESNAPPPDDENNIQRKCEKCEQEDNLQKKGEEDELLQESPLKLQRKPIFESNAEPPPDDENNIQRKCAECEQEEKLQKKPDSGQQTTSPAIESRLNSSKAGGSPLPADTKEQMENSFGADFSTVRLHTDSSAVQMNKDLNAQAFTYGNDIYFNSGKYNTTSTAGRHLLAHELTHTMQQGASGINPKIQRYSWDEFTSDVSDGVDAVGEGLSDAADAVVETAQDVGEAVYDAGAAVVDTVVDVATAAADWLATEAGELAQSLVEALGGSINITSAGLEIHIPGGCPLDALTHEFTLDAISNDWMVPIFEFPIPPDILISGEIGLAGSITPEVQVQLGPICMDDVHIIINPFTSNYSISGGMSITSALSLGAEMSGGLKGELSLTAIIPIGPVPVPITIPLLSAEGGPVVLIRGIGAQTNHIGGVLSYSSGTITASPDLMMDVGLAGDLFAGAYAQLEVLGQNLCSIYWQPYEWHGGIASSLGISGDFTWAPGMSAPGISVDPPTLDQIPFDDIPLAINRHGFSDDCPLVDRICEILRALNLLPSQNGGSWDWSATGRSGTYGPGARLDGPMDVYESDPHIKSESLCRGACGINCNTCEPHPVYRYTDPANGDVWEYYNFQDCNSNDGCREHDAAFDWAADMHGETGDWAIIMPWHMAANIECACNNLGGNCIAWIAGLPPYDMKMYFAESSKKISSGTPGLPPIPPGGGGGSSMGDTPIGEVGPDFYHYSPSPPSGDFTARVERWTDYRTNCQAEAEAATGVANHRFITTLPDAVADTYIDRSRPTTRRVMSVIHGVIYPYFHYTNHTVIPSGTYSTASLTIFSPNCQSPSGSNAPSGNEEEDLESCDRNELPPDYCNELQNRVIERFGNRERNIGFNPDTDIDEGRRRVDDTPASTRFRLLYNRLDSWDYYILRRHNEMYPEFDSNFHVNRDRTAWMDELKQRTEEFKGRFRDLRTQDTDQLVRDFENGILHELEQRINNRINEIAIWYKARTGTTESLADLTERIHREGTELWRNDWRAAILAVNRVLSRLWPPAKGQIQNWVAVQRGTHPGEDLSGSIGDIDYVGSLATGYKGVPKQYVRFNPRSFDVDANLEAPPLHKFAMNILGIIPKHGRIFAIGNNTTITPLINFCFDAHRELSPIEGYDRDEQFDVVINAPETAGQTRTRTATDRVYALRGTLGEARYNQMVNELRAAGLLVDETETGGWRLKPELSRTEMQRFNHILGRYE